MRHMTILLAAALAATPAVAQNEAADTNAVEANAAAPMDHSMMAANDMMAAPDPVPATTEPVAEPAPPRESRGFPWGVIGLVGLVGLLGRRRRND